MALKVFISSKMAELRDVREIVGDALRKRGIEAFIYEESAGARPDTVLTTSLREVEEADVYVGLFWQKYGEVTIEEYRHARKHDKPCFVYIRDKDLQREPDLETFLRAEVYDLTKGVTYDYFDSALQLADAVARDVTAWLVRRYRELSAQVRAAEVSREEIERLQAEVMRLQAISREPLPQGDAVDNLARQLREWFHAIGYGLERDVQRSVEYAELVINIPRRRRGYDRILVRALDGEIEVSHVCDLCRVVNEQDFGEGWLVSERRVSKAAREEAETHDVLFVYTFDELIDEEVNWDRYFAWLENEVKSKDVDKYYVHLSGTVDDLSPEGERLGTSHYEKLDDYVDLWLDDPSKEHISILGEFGTGKTWFTLHYAHRMMQAYQEAKAKGLKRPRVPLIIQLRNYAQGFKDVGALLSEFVFREHEIGLPGYSAFGQLNRMGRLLLIFDGFDEMAARVDRQKMVNNFWELAKVVVPGSKAILTCRTEHFHYARQEREVLRGKLRASTSAIVLEAPKFEVLHLGMFGDEQIREVLNRRTDALTVETIMDHANLVDMARRPLLIEFILEALPEVQEGEPADMAHIYYYAARRKMERDINEERTFTSLADKLYFLCELSWEMLSTDRMSLSYKLFPEHIRRYFGPKVVEVEEDHWHYDLLGQTMLARDADGNYTPAHRSLLEFFVAYKFAAEMGALLSEFTEAARRQSNISADTPARDYPWSAYFYPEQDERGKVRPIPPLRSFTREAMERLVTTVGAQRLTSAVLMLMKDMVDPERLWSVIEATRGRNIKDVGYTGGNAATLLRLNGASFARTKLASTVLAGADFTGADLTAADLREAVLRSSVLTSTILVDVRLNEADLSHVEIEEIGQIRSVSYSPDARYLAAGGDNGIVVWETANYRPVLFLQPDYRDYDTGGKFPIQLSLFPELERVVKRVKFCEEGDHLLLMNSQFIMTLKIPTLEKSNKPKYLILGYVATDFLPQPGHHMIIWTRRRSTDSRPRMTRYVEEYKLQRKAGLIIKKEFRGGFVTPGLVQSAEYKREEFSVQLVDTSDDIVSIIPNIDDGDLGLVVLDGKILAFNSYEQTLAVTGKTEDDLPGNNRLAPGNLERRRDAYDLLAKYGVEDTSSTLDACLSPDGLQLAAAGTDGIIRVWDVNAGVEPRIVDPRISCRGMHIRGTKGLNAPAPRDEGTLREWLKERGALE